MEGHPRLLGLPSILSLWRLILLIEMWHAVFMRIESAERVKLVLEFECLFAHRVYFLLQFLLLSELYACSAFALWR